MTRADYICLFPILSYRKYRIKEKADLPSNFSFKHRVLAHRLRIQEHYRALSKVYLPGVAPATSAKVSSSGGYLYHAKVLSSEGLLGDSFAQWRARYFIIASHKGSSLE